MPPVFGRNTRYPHPYDDAFGELLANPNVDFRAMGRNLMYDHRVTPEREQAFDVFFPPPRTRSGLHAAIVDYFKEKVLSRWDPDFADPDLNRENFVPTTPLSPHVHPDLLLARVIDLNKLRTVYSWAKGRGMDPFTAFGIDGPDLGRALDHNLEGQPPSAVARFIRLTLQAMNAYRRHERHQPTWATTWEAFEPYVTEGPDRWLEVLGLQQATEGHWLIVLHYPVGEIRTLVRPTQLDAEWYAPHFPSPPQTPLWLGGHPMDMSVPCRAALLLPEYIHQQIDHWPRHWEDAGALCARSTRPTPCELGVQRPAHHALLGRQYGSGVSAWMPYPC